jgi:hypothetical protein
MSILFRTGLLFCIISLVWLTPVDAPGSLPPKERDLLADYRMLETRLNQNYFGIPLHIESYEGNDLLEVKVYGVLDHSFEKLRHIFEQPSNWCEIVPLHSSIGFCTYSEGGRGPLLTFYGGKKAKRPEDAYNLKYRYNGSAEKAGYFAASLTADEGPLNTSDHRIEVELVPLSRGKTLIRFSCSYRYGRLAQVAMKSYFATVGRNKIGFSPAGSDRRGNPVFVGGMIGAIERNAMRSYLAILAYMETFHISGEQRLDKRLNRWYDLTEKYRRQLYEVERNEYLEMKKRGYRTQLQLQSRISAEAEKKK